jgi:hypothetical protein
VAHVLKLLWIVILVFPLPVFSEENYGLNTPSFLPLSAHVGDPVLYHVELVVPERAVIEPPAVFPVEMWIEVTDVRINLRKTLEARNVYDVSVMFISFAAGVQSLPPLHLGDVTLRDIEVTTLSILEPDGTLRLAPSRGQMVLPSTWLVLILGFCAGALCIVFVAGFIVFGRNLIIRIAENRVRKLPARNLVKSLKSLLSNTGNQGYKDFIVGISQITRTYIEERLRLPALCSTTSEIRSLFEAKDLNERAKRETARILFEADEVKFGYRTLDEGGMREVARRVANLPVVIDEGAMHVER